MERTGEERVADGSQCMKEDDVVDNSLAVLPFPISLPTSASRSYEVMGIRTDAFCQLFGDRLFVGVSQLNQKIGNFVMCQAKKSPIDNSVDFHISTVLGNREDAMSGVYARRITERLIKDGIMPDPINLFLGISLRDSGADPKMFEEVVGILYLLIRESLAITGRQ